MERVITSIDEVPGASRLSGRGLRHAAGNVLRVLVLLLCLFTLFLARWDAPIVVLLVLVAASLVTLYALDRRTGGFGVWAAYFVGFILFALLRTLADNAGFPVRAGYVVHADEWLFGGVLPQHWLQQHLYHPGSVSPLEVFCVAVIFSYYVVPHLVALGLWRRKPAEFKRYALAVLIAVYAGLALSVLLPTAPPWLASRFTDAPQIFRVEALFLNWNPESLGPGPANGTNPVAAMPSLHFTLTAIIIIALWRHRYLRLASLLYAAAMAFSLVFMGEHYVVDLLAGVATAAFAWLAASMLVGGRMRVRRDHPVPAAPAPVAAQVSAMSERS